MAWTIEKVTVDMLRPGVPFYLANPLENKNVLVEYNVNCELPGDTEVWVVFQDWQTNPAIKKECFVKVKGNQAANIINNWPGPGWTK